LAGSIYKGNLEHIISCPQYNVGKIAMHQDLTVIHSFEPFNQIG